MSDENEYVKRRRRGEAVALVNRMKRAGQKNAYLYECLTCRAWHVDVSDGSARHRNRHFCR